MAKALKTAALVVGAVALVATGLGAAAGVLAPTILGAGGAASAFGISATALTAIGTIGAAASGILSVAAGLTAKKPTAEATGSQVQFAADPDAFIPLVIGRIMDRGIVRWRLGT